MLAERRREEILKTVEERQTVSVPELSEMLGISDSTIRRDLILLDREQKLHRVHGGATALDRQFVMNDEVFAQRTEHMQAEKEAIGSFATALIKPDDFVYIDAGTTTDRLVDALTERAAVYVTNSIGHALKLLRRGFQVILPGGELKPKTEAMVGADTVDAIRRFHFTVGFWGTNAVSPEAGFTTPEMNEAMVKKASMEQAAKCYVLCDHSKFALVSPVTFAAFNAAEIITDRLPDESYRQYCNITVSDFAEV